MKKFEPKAEVILRGEAVSPGVAIGKVFLLAGTPATVDKREISAREIPLELAELHDALAKTKAEIKHDFTIAREQIGEEAAQVFEVSYMILEDLDLLGEVERVITTEHVNAELAFHRVMNKFAASMNHGIFADRRVDLEDLERRVIRHLQGERREDLHQIDGETIVVAAELAPSAVLALNRRRIRGVATDLGGKTSHTSLMLHSYGLPAVVGLREATKHSTSASRVIVDGHEGLVLINPEEDTLARYQKLYDEWMQKKNRLGHLRALPSRTRDGRDVELAANLEFADEAKLVQSNGARGVGLLRSEYLYFGRPAPPSEEEQFQEYSRIAAALTPAPVIIRTMDLGGDKCPECMNIPAEANPFLGWRAIRICLEMPELFKDQIRAIFRASALGNVKMLLPMISGVQELEQALAVIAEAKHELRKAGKTFNPETEVGVMIEVPSAALLADLIAERVDFLSIGTNDLMQYALAADRGNEHVAHLLTPLHPAMLRLIRNVINAGHSRGVWVSMCGAMAADPLATMVLVGMEIDQLSMSPVDVPEIKNIIRNLNFREAKEIAEHAMTFSTSQEIYDFVRPIMRRRFKDVMV